MDLACEMAIKAVRTVHMTENGRTEIDIKRFAKVEKVPGGSIEDSVVLNGVMMNKDITHPKMKRRIEQPRILLMDCGLEYTKVFLKFLFRTLDFRIRVNLKLIWNCQKKLTSPEFSNLKKLTSRGSVTILSLLNQLWSLPKKVFLILLNTFWQRLVSVPSEESEKQTILGN